MCDVNHDVRHKASLVPDGQLTDIPVEDIYSGAVYLLGIQLLVFIYDPNKMETWDIDIVNVYLEAKKVENFYIIVGTEFGDREGKINIFDMVLYGIWYFGILWNGMFDNCIIDMGFFLCKLEPDIWIQKNGDILIHCHICRLLSNFIKES